MENCYFSYLVIFYHDVAEVTSTKIVLLKVSLIKILDNKQTVFVTVVTKRLALQFSFDIFSARKIWLDYF